MVQMFRSALAFNQNVDGWRTGSVTSTERMFHDAAAFNQNIDSWQTDSVNTKDTFSGAGCGPTIASCGPSAAAGPACGDVFVATDSNVFCQVRAWCAGSEGVKFQWHAHCCRDGDLEENDCDLLGFATTIPPACWDTKQVTDTSHLFACLDTCNPDVDSWRTGSVKDVPGMFEAARAFNQPLNSWQTDAVRNTESTFARGVGVVGTIFNQNINAWQTGSVTSTASTFESAKQFDQNINSWQMDAVKNTESMFARRIHITSVFNQNINAWQTSSVTSTKRMFHRAAAFNQNINAWRNQQRHLDGGDVPECPCCQPEHQRVADQQRHLDGGGVPVRPCQRHLDGGDVPVCPCRQPGRRRGGPAASPRWRGCSRMPVLSARTLTRGKQAPW